MSSFRYLAQVNVLMAALVIPMAQGAESSASAASAATPQLPRMNAALSRLGQPLSISNVTLAMVVPHMESPITMTEEMLNRVGCVYRSSDQAQIRVLTELLHDAKPRSAFFAFPLQLERLLTVEFINGSRLRFQFGATYSAISGVPGALEDERFIVDESFESDLSHWADGLARTNCSPSLGWPPS